jgi:hypothetical protein
MNRPKSPAQLQRIFGLLRTLNIDGTGRAQLVHQYTSGRSSSAADLYAAEAVALIDALRQTLPAAAPADKADKMRKRIISMAHEMGWVLTNNGQRSTVNKIDRPRINAWTLKYGYLHKQLNAYTVSELPTLVTQFENMYKQFLNEIGK